MSSQPTEPVVFRDEAAVERSLRGLRSPEEDEREQSLRDLTDLYVAWMRDNTGGDPESLAYAKESACYKHVLTVVRLSRECPHTSVRETLARLVEDLREWGVVAVPDPAEVSKRVSFYIPDAEVIPIDTEVEEVRSEFLRAFESDGRVSHMTRIMAYHPLYLERFREQHNSLLWDEGPLPLTYRFMLAVLACWRHDCRYLIQIHSQFFLDVGGDPTWLQGRDKLPKKLQSILVLNSLLAHQPWRVNAAHVSVLLKSGAENWSLSELTQAIVILAHFHALCGFIFGCGIAPEIDLARPDQRSPKTQHKTMEGTGSDPSSMTSSTSAQAPPVSSASSSATASGSAVATAVLATGTATAAASGAAPLSAKAEERCARDILAKLRSMKMDAKQEITPEDNMRNFVETAGESIPPTMSSRKGTDEGRKFGAEGLPDAPPYIKDDHVEFEIKSREYEVFRIQQFSWADHGFSTLNRYNEKLATLVDETFQCIKDLTYESFADEKGVDTFKFRWAIWNYVLRLQGVVNDEYLYYEVNQLVTREIKNYCRTIVFFPDLVTEKQYQTFVDEMTNSERVHINLLAIEARKQAELLFALNAVMKASSTAAEDDSS